MEAFDAALGAAAERDPRLSALVGRARARLAGGRAGRRGRRPRRGGRRCTSRRARTAPAAILRFDLASAYRPGRPAARRGRGGARRRVDVLGPARRAGPTPTGPGTCWSRIYRELDEPDQALALLETAGRQPGRVRQPASPGRRMLRGGRRRCSTGPTATRRRPSGSPPRRRRTGRPGWPGRAARPADAGARAALGRRARRGVAALAEADALAATLAGRSTRPRRGWCGERAMLAYDAGAGAHRRGPADEALDRIDGRGRTRSRRSSAFGEALQAELLHGELLLRSGAAGARRSRCCAAVLGGRPRRLAGRSARGLAAGRALEALDRPARPPRSRRSTDLEQDELNDSFSIPS